MNKRLVILFVGIVTALTLFKLLDGSQRGLPHLKVSELNLQSLGKTDLTQLSENTGPALVHFWASWCGPCKEEFPELIKSASNLNPGLKVILISADEEKEKAIEFLAQYQFPPNWILYWDQNKAATKKFDVDRFPETLAFDHQLLLLRRIAGVLDWQHKKNIAFFNSL